MRPCVLSRLWNVFRLRFASGLRLGRFILVGFRQHSVLGSLTYRNALEQRLAMSLVSTTPGVLRHEVHVNIRDVLRCVLLLDGHRTRAANPHLERTEAIDDDPIAVGKVLLQHVGQLQEHSPNV